MPTAVLTGIVAAALLAFAWESRRQGRLLERDASEVRAATALAFALADVMHEEEHGAILGGADEGHVSAFADAEGRGAALAARIRALPLPPRAASVWAQLERARGTLAEIARDLSAARARGDPAGAALALEQWRLVSGRAEALLADFTAFHLRRLDRTVAELQRRRARALAVGGAAVGLGFLVAVAFAIAIARTFVRPIVEMAGAAGRITATGPLEPVAGAARADEIGVLARAFNGMTERLVRANAELAAAVRTREDFISIASHELKTPLTPLALRVQQLLRVLRDAPELRREDALRAARTLERHVAALARLVDNLLDVSQLTSGAFALRPQPVQVAEVAREALARMADPLASAGCEARLVCARNPTIRADRARLEQVLANLLGNAAKYAAGAPVVVTVDEDEAGAVVSVADGGPGVSPADRERIFARFERVVAAAHREVSGLGLGLFIAREIVRAHGGDVGVDGGPGGGATFVVRLPREPPAATAARG